jgi:hypothetical protein
MRFTGEIFTGYSNTDVRWRTPAICCNCIYALNLNGESHDT